MAFATHGSAGSVAMPTTLRQLQLNIVNTTARKQLELMQYLHPALLIFPALVIFNRLGT